MSALRPRDRYGRPLPPGAEDQLAAADAPSDLPAETPGTVVDAYLRGVALFDTMRFFEAHECFEFVWKAADVHEQDRPFWKGVTQVAVGCCHVQRGNVKGAVALLTRATQYLRPYPSSHCGIDTTALIAVARHVADQVAQGGASAAVEFPKFPNVV
jgi:predicted metal-dependent hydrolase